MNETNNPPSKPRSFLPWRRAATPARKALAPSGISYQDIGGLAKEVARVREMIDLPFRHPELFERLGIDAPKGILLYGPPGSGKTLIARAVAHESGARFFNVSGPEVVQQGYGESEAQLRKIFAEAQEHPASIIFFDEIDALAPNRDTTLGEVEKRIVGQLLALMDGLHARGRIVVIGATNLPNNIDPALRRPGRFDREIELSPPDKAGRLEILRVHTRHMPLDTDVNLELVAALTHGFLGADLAALCREAAILSGVELMALGIPGEAALERLRVAMRHFERARAEIELSTTRQLFSETPDTSWEDVGGLGAVAQRLREAVEWPLKYRERFASADLAPPKGILLTGRPGTGKTLLAKTVAAESGLNFIMIRGPELLSKWVGDSERGIREVFKKARQAAPCILFFDEIDAMLPARGAGSDAGGVNERMVSQFLAEMDNIEPLAGLAVLAATNRPDLIDPALLRPGRFDLQVELTLPDTAGRLEILRLHCRRRTLAPDVDLGGWAAQSAGCSGAELEALCRRAALAALRRSIAAEPEAGFTPFPVTAADFAAAWAEMRPAPILQKGDSRAET